MECAYQQAKREDAMDALKALILGVLLMPLCVQAQSCDDIKDKDKANYCRATTTNDKSFCQKIGASDTLNLCMGKLENDIKYCRRITTEKIKKRCENSIR
jgi:hypothetical protein